MLLEGGLVINKRDHIQQSNVSLIKYFWLTWVFGMLVEIFTDAPLSLIYVLGIGGLVIFGLLNIIIAYKKIIEIVPYLMVVAAYSLCFLMVVANPHITTQLLFFYGIAMFSFYQDKKITYLTGVFSISLSVVSFFLLPSVYEGYHFSHYATYIAIIFIVAGSVIGQITVMEKIQRKVDAKNEEVIQKNKENDLLLSQTRASIDLLSDFTRNLKTSVNESNEFSDVIVDRFKYMGESLVSQGESAADVRDKMNITNLKVKDINDNFELVSENADKTLRNIDVGKEEVHNVGSKINSLNQIIQTASHTLQDLNEKNMEIEKTLEMISDISHQTQLLAFNASIEAHRAGEAGRGFSVVANEVNQLATKSEKSVKSINSIMGYLKTKIEDVTSEVNQGNMIVKESNDSLNSFKDIFDIFSHSAHDMKSKTTMVDELMSELNLLSEVISKNMEQVTEASNGNVSSINELYEVLETQSSKMKVLLESSKEMEKHTDTLREGM